MIGLDFWLQLLVVLFCLFYGARKGGMALGLLGGIGLLVLVFGFGLKPGKPPVDVMLTILAVVCGSATLQSAGAWIACFKSLKRFCAAIPVTSASSLRTSAGS